jgi:hypothetical protein
MKLGSMPIPSHVAGEAVRFAAPELRGLLLLARLHSDHVVVYVPQRVNLASISYIGSPLIIGQERR